jgi:cell division protein FtsL
VFGVVTLQALVSQSSFRMQEISRQNAQLQQSYGELKLQVAQLSAPGRIAQQARRLGLRMPDGGNVHTLDVAGPVDGGQSTPTMQPAAFALKRLLGDQP